MTQQEGRKKGKLAVFTERRQAFLTKTNTPAKRNRRAVAAGNHPLESEIRWGAWLKYANSLRGCLHSELATRKETLFPAAPAYRPSAIRPYFVYILGTINDRWPPLNCLPALDGRRVFFDITSFENHPQLLTSCFTFPCQNKYQTRELLVRFFHSAIEFKFYSDEFY